MRVTTRAGVWLGIVAVAGLGLSACSGNTNQTAQQNGASEETTDSRITAQAELHPTEGSEAQGVVTFTETDDGVRVVANLRGLEPGRHGFHIHEFGDCSAPDAESAGGHFNPTNQPHGAPTDAARHVGDLGNIDAGPDGTAHFEWVDPVLQLTGDNAIVGRSVVVHANPDDLTSQPSGNAGGRLACGIITVEQR